VTIRFPAPVAGIESRFDHVAILSGRSPRKEAAVLGPFHVAEHKPGSHVLLRRNPHYWKRDAAGNRLPYLDAVRLEIHQNRDLALMRFRRGQLHLINDLDAEQFDRLAAESPGSVRDAGPSLDSEFLWFNQVARAPIEEYRKTWFRSAHFRRAVSEAIQREDLCRVVFRGRARPAAGPISPANRFWVNAALKPHPYDPASALRRLAQDGFRQRQGTLYDREGHPVEFSLLTNAGNKMRERMAAMIQQDLAKLGIRLNLVTVDFPSLIERITRTFQYEACLLGLLNSDLDPNDQMNVWLSSASNHQWNPAQKTPETTWEAEIDRLVRAQAAAADPAKRKASFDRVQQIVWEQAPFVYLVNRNALAAVSPALGNVALTPLSPGALSNIEHVSFRNVQARK
jgi:peptide/nickel transport system substrate-binding protein